MTKMTCMPSCNALKQSAPSPSSKAGLPQGRVGCVDVDHQSSPGSVSVGLAVGPITTHLAWVALVGFMWMVWCDKVEHAGSQLCHLSNCAPFVHIID